MTFRAMLSKEENRMVESSGRQILMTLGKGKKARQFFWEEDDKGITVWVGSPRVSLTHKEISDCLDHFRGRWFPLGADMVNPTTGGLGEYLRNLSHISNARYACHFAAVWVRQNRLVTRDEGNAIYLKVV
jgi:hypothetical protein